MKEFCLDDSHSKSKGNAALSPLTRNTWQHNSPNLDQMPNMHVGTVLICNVRGRKKMYEAGKNIIKSDLQTHATEIYFS